LEEARGFKFDNAIIMQPKHITNMTSLFQAIYFHSQALSRWAREAIADASLPPERSFYMFQFFTKLALASFAADDHFTSSSLLRGIRSDVVLRLESHWRSFMEYNAYRQLWRLSEIDAAMIVVPARTEENRRSVYSELQKTRYDKLCKSGKSYLCAIQPLVHDVEDLRVVSPNLLASGYIFDLKKAVEAYERVRILQDGVAISALEKESMDIVPSLMSALVNGPLRVVSHLPLLLTARIRCHFSELGGQILDISLDPNAFVELYYQFEYVDSALPQSSQTVSRASTQITSFEKIALNPSFIGDSPLISESSTTHLEPLMNSSSSQMPLCNMKGAPVGFPILEVSDSPHDDEIDELTMTPSSPKSESLEGRAQESKNFAGFLKKSEKMFSTIRMTKRSSLVEVPPFLFFCKSPILSFCALFR
jgi:hypothetical protein